MPGLKVEGILGFGVVEILDLGIEMPDLGVEVPDNPKSSFRTSGQRFQTSGLATELGWRGAGPQG